MSDSIWPVIHDERHALIADLETLSLEQWQLPSLCTDWTVHDVLAHLVSLARMTPPRFLMRFARARFDFNRYIGEQLAAERGDSPATTLDRYRAVVDRTSAPPGPKASWLGETFVHAEDIRRPLGIHRNYPADAVARALTFYSHSNTIIGGKSRVADLTLRPTDADLTVGSGPEVTGTAIALLLATSGRSASWDELDGPGLNTLKSRS
jgi:uncharacterized protein (TIGR03083 family)